MSQKFNAKNYLLWIQQVEPAIHSHHLEGYIANPKIPQKYASIEDHNANKVNGEFTVWYEQDQFLLAWLQSTIFGNILPRVIGCQSSWQLWDQIQSHFQSLITPLIINLFGLSFACSDVC